MCPLFMKIAARNFNNLFLPFLFVHIYEIVITRHIYNSKGNFLLRLNTLINVISGRVVQDNYTYIYSRIIDYYFAIHIIKLMPSSQHPSVHDYIRKYVSELERQFTTADIVCFLLAPVFLFTEGRMKRAHDKWCVALINTCRLTRMMARHEEEMEKKRARSNVFAKAFHRGRDPA